MIIWSRNFSHSADVKVSPKMAEIEGAIIGGHCSPHSRAAAFFVLSPRIFEREMKEFLIKI